MIKSNQIYHGELTIICFGELCQDTALRLVFTGNGVGVVVGVKALPT